MDNPTGLKVKFEVMSKEEQAGSIAGFFGTFPSKSMAQYIIKWFGLDIAQLKGKSEQQQYDYIFKIISPLYDNAKKEMEEKKELFQRHWDTHQSSINEEFAKIFDYEIPNKKCIGNVNLNPISPRYIENWSFDLPHGYTASEAFSISIHEIIHFLWFNKWKKIFPNWKPQDFECPSFSWLLSEISVDPIIKNSELLTKLTLKNQRAYDYFYTDKFIDEKTPVEIFRKLYSENSLDQYMKKGLSILNKNYEQTQNLIR